MVGVSQLGFQSRIGGLEIVFPGLKFPPMGSVQIKASHPGQITTHVLEDVNTFGGATAQRDVQHARQQISFRLKRLKIHQPHAGQALQSRRLILALRMQ